VAYAWPHRPGGGLCCWPDPPTYRLNIPAGTHSWPRIQTERLPELFGDLPKLGPWLLR
jgi:hypothetical protein